MIDFRNFWPTLNDRTKEVFVDLVGSHKDASLYSVFPLANPGRNPKRPNVQYSGEPYMADPEAFDATLSMIPGARCVVFPLFSLVSYEYRLWEAYARPRSPLEKTRFCVFVVSNEACAARNRFFEKLSAYKRVDSAGGYLNNLGGDRAPRDRDAYMAFLAQYKFMICFENTSLPNYLTEKLSDAYMGNTVPIYWGAQNAPKWLNKDAFLALESDSEEAMDALVERVRELDTDPRLYRRVFQQPLLATPGVPETLSMERARQELDKLLINTKDK